MSGRYSWQSGTQIVFAPQSLQHLPFFNGVNTKLLPQYLKVNGYMTFGIGKWHLVRFSFILFYIHTYMYNQY